VASWREYNGRKLGPYYRLAYREEGRQRSIYLGRCRARVEKVREALDAVQAPRRQERCLRRMKAEAKAGLRAAKAELDRQLRAVGLSLKGFEIRGRRRAICPTLLAISPLSADALRFVDPVAVARMGVRTGKCPASLTKDPRCVGAPMGVEIGKQPRLLTKRPQCEQLRRGSESENSRER